jgi:xanthine dehydrogenase accessory factor
MARDMLARGCGTRLVSMSAEGPGETACDALLTVVRQAELDIVLFGAGHVGQALAKLLAELPCRVTWVDGRADRFPSILPRNLRAEITDEPLAEVDAARPGACFLVMTHSHPLDQALAEAILRRGDFRYFGLIGSLAKRRRFESRLAARGMPVATFERMTCPIGIEGVEGKAPAVIAVAVAAQLLQVQARPATACRCGPPPSSSSSHP